MTDPNYVSIVDARTLGKGDIIVKCLTLGELVTGNTKSGESFKRMNTVLKDNSDVQQCTLWGGDIGKLEQGKYYKLASPYWKEYKGDMQLSLGNYCTVQECTEADLLPYDGQTPAASAPKPEVKTAELNLPETITQDQISEALEIMKSSAVDTTLDKIWACEILIKSYLKAKEKKEPNLQRVGLWMKLLLNVLKIK